MNVKLLLIVLAFSLTMIAGYFLSSEYISSPLQSISFSIEAVYMFHSFFSLALCFMIFFLAKSPRFINQIGFIYLISFVFKLILFSVVFNSYVKNMNLNTVNESLMFLSPLFIALIFEVLFVSQILKRNQVAKND